MLRGGTQTGKTTAGVLEAWDQALSHPGSVGLILGADWPAMRDVIGKKMWELAPRWALAAGSEWNSERGWKNRQIRLKNGSVILLRSGEGKQTGVAGLTLDWLWIDEPPPRHLFGELLSRVAAQQGPAWMTLTPIGRPCGWLRDHIEGDPNTDTPPAEDWEQHVMRLSPEDCPHRSPESIAAQIASYGPWERAQRVDAAWDGVTVDRMYEDYGVDSVVEVVDRREWSVALGIDHGERAGRQAALLLVWSNQPTVRLHVLAEYVSDKATTPEEDAEAIRTMMREHGLTPNQVDLAVGDANTGGKLTPGRKINDLLSRELDDLRIRTPSKGPGSVHYGVRLLNAAMRRGHLVIHPRCTALDHALRHWRGKSSEHDAYTHTLDALRYACVPILERVYDPHELDRYRLIRG